MTLDLTKPVQTRDGRPVEIITTKGRGVYPIIGYAGKSEYPVYWTSEGSYIFDERSKNDLMNVPEKHVVWFNFYPGNAPPVSHKTKEKADSTASQDRIACVRVEYVEGEGL